MNQVQQNLVQMGILRALQEQQQQGKIFVKILGKKNWLKVSVFRIVTIDILLEIMWPLKIQYKLKYGILDNGIKLKYGIQMRATEIFTT